MGKQPLNRRTLLAATAVGGVLSTGASAPGRRHRFGAVPQPATGPFRRIYDPSVGEPAPWYINDHCFVRGPDGSWHLFGITHPEPAAPEDEDLFAHAQAPSLHGPWKKHPPAMATDPGYGETHLWAPFVLFHRGVYHMFYAGGGEDPTQQAINLATSTDLFHWTRHPDGPLFLDGFQARDPMVVRIGGTWVLYYTATGRPEGGHHVVAYRTSTDLTHWGPRQIAYTSERAGTGGGDTESPFLTRHGTEYYLFIGPCGAYEDRPDGYTCTATYYSSDPFHFTASQRASRFPSHAAEVVQDVDGSWWASHAGWGQGGVYLAPLYWTG